MMKTNTTESSLDAICCRIQNRRKLIQQLEDASKRDTTKEDTKIDLNSTACDFLAQSTIINTITPFID